MGVGNAQKIKNDKDMQRIINKKPLCSGITLIKKTLEESREPVVIHVVGSCRDVAAAIYGYPQLFKEKCRAIYLNAGTGYSKEDLEYNVALDSYSFEQIFKAPCPVYWMPCYTSSVDEIGEYGTFYRFKQKEILPYLSFNIQKYFSYALMKNRDLDWLSYLRKPIDVDYIKEQGELYRNMWCTAGFLHTAGKTVTSNGDIVSLQDNDTKAVFDFIPIRVVSNKDGRINWEITNVSTNRYIFKVLDLENYQSAMTKALKTLLSELP